MGILLVQDSLQKAREFWEPSVDRSQQRSFQAHAANLGDKTARMIPSKQCTAHTNAVDLNKTALEP